MKYKYIDAHIHLYQFNTNELANLLKSKDYIFLAVSEDVKSSLENIKLSMLYENVIPAVGIHPWNVDKMSKKDIEQIKKLVDKENIKVLGEIGLDKKFVPQTYEKQLEIFKEFLEVAKDYDLSLNIHSVNTHREVYDLLLKFDIKKAYFHWYTGPLDLIEEITSSGYFIGINVAYFVQEKHRKVLEKVDIRNILTESDGPYKYRNTVLHPEKLQDLYNEISKVKDINLNELYNNIKRNLSIFLS